MFLLSIKQILHLKRHNLIENRIISSTFLKLDIQKVPNTSSPFYAGAIEIYSNSFPEWEKEPTEEIAEKINNKEYILLSIGNNSNIFGMVILEVNVSEKYMLLSYIAVREDVRCLGIGTSILQTIKEIFTSLYKEGSMEYLFIEAENRQARLYGRIGALKLDCEYLTPSYSENDTDEYPMNLMVFTPANIRAIKNNRLSKILLDIYILSYQLEKDSDFVQKQLKNLIVGEIGLSHFIPEKNSINIEEDKTIEEINKRQLEYYLSQNKLKIVRCEGIRSSEWKNFKHIYEMSFNENVREPINIYEYPLEIEETLAFLLKTEQNEVLGYFTVDVYEKVLFLNHIYINPQKRRQKYGTFLLMFVLKLLVKYGKTEVVVEAENAFTPFYKYNNFNKIDINYKAPDFKNENNFLPYNLLISRKRKLPTHEIKDLVREIYKLGYYMKEKEIPSDMFPTGG